MSLSIQVLFKSGVEVAWKIVVYLRLDVRLRVEHYLVRVGLVNLVEDSQLVVQLSIVHLVQTILHFYWQVVHLRNAHWHLLLNHFLLNLHFFLLIFAHQTLELLLLFSCRILHQIQMPGKIWASPLWLCRAGKVYFCYRSRWYVLQPFNLLPQLIWKEVLLLPWSKRVGYFVLHLFRRTFWLSFQPSFGPVAALLDEGWTFKRVHRFLPKNLLNNFC